MSSFNIELRDDKQIAYRRFTLIVIITLFLLFIYLVISADNSVNWHGVYLALSMLVLLFVFQLFAKKERGVGVYWGYLFFLMMGWANLKIYWLAIATLALQFLYLLTVRKKIVSFQEDFILYPSFPRKKIQWFELNNALIKDNLLTLDFKNNKLIQQTIDESKTSVNEQEFNEFCRTQLALNAKR